jgi:ATP-dependent Lon protease
LRGGVTKVLIPSDNVKDLREIPDNVKNGLELIPVSNVLDVLRTALVREPEPIEWNEEEEAAKALAAKAPGTAAAPPPAH